LNIGSKVYSHTRGSLLQNGKNRHFDDVGSKVSLVGAHLAPAVAIPVMLFSSQDECRLAIRREERYPLTGDSKSYDMRGFPFLGSKIDGYILNSGLPF
jgi:hypothetical protein